MSTNLGLNVHSNDRKRCAYCGLLITLDTDSGWEVFVAGTITQPVCVGCNAENDAAWGEEDTAGLRE